MAATVKNDLLGSRQSRNLGDIRRNTAMRRSRVEALDNDNNDLGDAIAALIADADVGEFHQDDTILPLVNVDVYEPARAKANAFLRYAHHEASDPTRAAFAYAEEYQSGMRRQQVITIEEDAWSYTVDATEITHDRAFIKRRLTPITTILVRTVLDSHPGSSPVALYSTINDGVVPINGVDRVAKSLLFFGWNTRWVDTHWGVRWPTVYKFLWNPLTWSRPRLTSSLQIYEISGYAGVWAGRRYSVATVDDYDTAEFYNSGTETYAFPVHA